MITPVYDGAAFLGRALAGLAVQSRRDWELVVVDDGSRDDPGAVLEAAALGARARLVRHGENLGLGAALNTGLDATTAPLIAYLPADDRYEPDHLERLAAALGADGALAVSGVRHGDGLLAPGAPPGHPPQLVQVMHRRTDDRWITRERLESDDLERLMWRRLRRRGRAVATGAVTCEWLDHPGQRHKAIRESFDGGLNVFRRRYRVRAPLRFHSSDSSPVDEPALYRRFRERRPTPPAPDGLRILLAGELAYNPERVLALEERGHELLGLWTDRPLGASTVGPMPFGHVRDLDDADWRAEIRRARPDVVYALLNWRAVPLAHAILTSGPRVPFVWHLKESPGRCIANGTWPLLVDLLTGADGVVYSSEEERRWCELALPGRLDPDRALVLDGDLPKREWMEGRPSARMGEGGDAVHTVALGRPIGFDADLVSALAARDVHLHLHGVVRAPGPGGGWQGWLRDAVRAAPDHLHVHPHVDQREWVTRLSRYDAGWLHVVRSANGGDLRRATWDDLNLPARIPPLVLAGVPVLAPASPGCAVAVQRLIATEGVGLLYRDLDDLAAQLRDGAAQAARRRATWQARERFTFDAHADRLVAHLRRAIERAAARPRGGG